MELYKDDKGSNKCIWVVNHSGELRCLYAPFRVVCITAVIGIKPETQVYVDRVIGTQGGQILYVIFKQPVSHAYFRIVIKF